MPHIESSGDMSGWPKNEPSKPTQTAVFGIKHGPAGLSYEILWTGKFPQLEQAVYWAAKKEMAAIRQNKFEMATRVIWQHDLTAEQAVAECFRMIKPQLSRSFAAADVGFDPAAALFSDPEGPMKPIDYSKVDKFYVEIDRPDGPLDGPLDGPPDPADPAPPGPRQK